MKNIIKNRWFPLIAAVVLLLLAVGIALIMSLFGWRFTFAPELENSCDAVSSIASWASVLIALLSVGSSFYAIYVAIQVPQKIAIKQNKIALFEKRIICYLELKKLESVCRSVEYENEVEKIKKNIMLLYSATVNEQEPTQMYSIAEFDRTVTICTQASFLFDNISSEEIMQICLLFGKLTLALFQKGKDNPLIIKNLYVQAMDGFISKHLGEIEKTLSIKD